MEFNLTTPCFVFDKDKLLSNTKDFQQALNRNFGIGIIGYSVKTNSYPSLLKSLGGIGCYAEVVSYTEYELALNLGFQKKNIVYNGPAKSKETFLDAINNNAVVNIDSFREIEWLKELSKERSFDIGIRVNLNLMNISPEDCKDGEEYSRFGFSEESGDLDQVLNQISSMSNINLAGLHLHRTTKTRNISAYQNIARYAIYIVRKYNLNLKYLDLGGGFYGDMPGKPTYDNYMDSIAEVLATYFDLKKLTIIVEPGNALAASVFHYYSSILDVKNINGNRVLVSDGSRNDIDPFFHKTSYFYKVLNDTNGREIVRKQVVVGCTCLENDRLFEIDNEEIINIGDVIKYHFVGAYTMCLSPLFIRYFPKVYRFEGGNYAIDREEWDALDFLQK